MVALSRCWLLVVLGLCCLLQRSESLRVQGRYRGTDSWKYLARFSFTEGEGKLEVEVMFPSRAEPKLGIYYLDQGGNEFKSWKETYSGDLSCQEKMERADALVEVQDRISTTNTKVQEIDGVEYSIVSLEFPFFSSRPRWLFLAAGVCKMNCDAKYCNSGVDIRWNVRFTSGDGWNKELDFQERGMFRTSVAFLSLYTLLLAGFIPPMARRLIKLRKFHSTVQLLVETVLLATIAVLLRALDAVSRGFSGEPEGIIPALSFCLLLVADWCLLLLVLLLAKGWTITCRKISAQGRVRIVAFMLVYCLISSTCMVYQKLHVGDEEISYIYDSWLGAVVVVLRLGVLVWFWRATYINLLKHNEKRGFYRKMRLFVSAWILTVPIVVFFNYFVVEYYREKVFYIVNLTCMFLLQAVLVLLYDPEGFFKNSFPFHSTVTMMILRNSGQQGEREYNIRRAAELNNHITYSSRSFARFSHDLVDFLTQIDPEIEINLQHDEDLPKSKSAKEPKYIAAAWT